VDIPHGFAQLEARLSEKVDSMAFVDGNRTAYCTATKTTTKALTGHAIVVAAYRFWPSFVVGVGYQYSKLNLLSAGTKAGTFSILDAKADEFVAFARYRYHPFYRVEIEAIGTLNFVYSMSANSDDELTADKTISGFDIHIKPHYMLTPAIFVGPSFMYGQSFYTWFQAGTFNGRQKLESNRMAFGIHFGIGF